MSTETSTINQVIGAMAGEQPSQETPEPTTPEPELEVVPDEKPAADASGSSEESEAPESEGETEAPESAAPITFKELAEELEIDVKDLYSVEIAIGGGEEPMTLGALKDAYKDFKHLESNKAEFQKQQLTGENELMRARQEFAQLAQMLPEITPEMQQAAQKAQQANLVKEQQALLKAIPEMADTQQAQVVNERVFKMGQEYGFSPVELGYIQDHRVIKLVNDFAKLQERLSQADVNSKKVTRVTKTPAKTAKQGLEQMRKAKLQKASKVNHRSDFSTKASAVAKVLAGG